MSLITEPEAPARGLLSVAALLLLAVLPIGCARSGSPTTAPADKVAPVEQKADRGPVVMLVRAEKGKITIAEKLNLSIEVTAADGVDVEMPAFGDKLDEFQIRDFKDRRDIPTGHGRQWRQDYILDILVSGEYAIPAITVKFTDHRDTNNVIKGEVTTSPLTIQVMSLLTGEFDPKAFNDIKGTVDLPTPKKRLWPWITAGAVAVALVVMIILLRRRRRLRGAVERVIPAHEWARGELKHLKDEHLVELGQVHTFYFRLTGIVRQYIERRFRIMAAEQTTDEFLAAARDHVALGGPYRSLLAEFLQAGDMVKFARYQPEPAEIDRAFDAAQDFVEQTAERPGAAREEAAS